MKEYYKQSKSAKYYASYCWEWKSQAQPDKEDIIINDNNYCFHKQWNPYHGQYAWYLDSLDKVGCIYTAQGLGFDYVGFIWWDDLVWRKDHWEFHPEKVAQYDSQFRNSIRYASDFEYLLLNIYRVMLTRAKKGLCIWFKDEETKEHFKDICLKEKETKVTIETDQSVRNFIIRLKYALVKFFDKDIFTEEEIRDPDFLTALRLICDVCLKAEGKVFDEELFGSDYIHDIITGKINL